MNTRQTIRNWDDMLMGDSEDERDRERDDHERQRQTDEEHYRERSGDRGRTRAPLSRRVTGAESKPHLKELKRTQEEGPDVPSDATPPKRAQPVPVRFHTDLGGVPDPKNRRPDVGGPSHPIPGGADTHPRVSAEHARTRARHMNAGDYSTTTP